MKLIKFCLLLFCLTCLASCGQVNDRTLSIDNGFKTFNGSDSALAETPQPKIIKKLNQQLEQYQPQVKIIAPRPGKIFEQTNVDVELDVKDLPIFKDEKLKLGNHLSLILDNEVAQKIYDLTTPIVLKDLSPGTHTIRVFATRPWGESFKNNSAYAQTTFSVLTETNNNSPDPNLPLLTYNNPTGTYGAEPFLLDFYLTNAPLHALAQNDPKVDDWQIRATVNGASFLIENWQPIYLEGLNVGENWIQLELIDEAGNNIENTFNNTVRVIDYNPQQIDTLSKLLADKISLVEAQPIVEQSYYIQPVGVPEIIEPSAETTEEKPNLSESNLNNKREIVGEESTVEEKSEIETSTIENPSAIAKNVSEPETISDLESKTELLEPESDRNFGVKTNISTIDTDKTLEQPVDISILERPKIEKTIETAKDSSTKNTDKVEATQDLKGEQTITIAEKNLDSTQPVAAIEIPQPESVEISEDEIVVTIPPQIEPNSASKSENSAPAWWKKILVGLRQKLENLVKLLPNEV